ncbi:hypothetical protein EB105725_12_01240 [Shimwellia blattae DSM 4481 = NBRC 105725]|nr:hypothetical protein EB105725_12_01240 [Shimwellia blattae DSM 4481 = NBRC 105725]
MNGFRSLTMGTHMLCAEPGRVPGGGAGPLLETSPARGQSPLRGSLQLRLALADQSGFGIHASTFLLAAILAASP